MDDETTKLIKEQYAKLPPALQEAIRSAGLHDQITKIGTNNQLHIDQMGLLEDEVSLLMMGFTEPIEFAGALQEHVHMDAASAQKIASEVNQEILLPIRERMENGTSNVEPPKTISNPSAVNNPPLMPEKSVVMPSSVAAATKPVVSIQTPAPTTAPLSNQVTAPMANLEINAPAASTNTPSAPANNTPTPVVKPVAAPMHEADVILNEPTVSMAPKAEVTTTPSATSAPATTPTAPIVPNITTKVEPPKPAPIYKADPYREPIE